MTMTEEELIAYAKAAGFSAVRTTWSGVKTSHTTLQNKTYKELARFFELAYQAGIEAEQDARRNGRAA